MAKKFTNIEDVINLENELDSEAARKLSQQQQAKSLAKSGAKLGVKLVTGTSVQAAATAATSTALSAIGLTAVAAPPFSTIIAVVALAGLAVGSAIRGARRKKFLSKDDKLLRKLATKYSLKSTRWRKKKAIKLLKRYNKLLSKGNKRFLRKKSRKNRLNWKIKKSKLEMKLKAVYASQYKKSYEKLIRGEKLRPPKITNKAALSEQKVVQVLKQKQSQSIDPRTSPFPLISPGKVEVTPALLKADAIQGQQSEVEIIQLAKDPQGVQKIALMPSDEQVHKQSVEFLKVQAPKNNKGLIIGVTAASALLVIGGAIAIARK